MKRKLQVLVIGSGGREHALGWKLRQSRSVGTLYFAPGNGGTSQPGKNIAIGVGEIQKLIDFAINHSVDLTIVGPEAPLALGIVDTFQAAGLTIFGPTQQAAKLETSKAWATEFMQRHGIPHPESVVLENVKTAQNYVREHDPREIVIKADGLAAGKGVIVPDSKEEAQEAIERMMVEKEFGVAGETIVVQERLGGPEVSVLAFCDGKIAVPLIPAQDHKRLLLGDRGPNTGGMGAYAPVRDVDVEEIRRTILQPTVDGMREEGHPYRGILFAGLMLTPQGPKVLEYNVRFGDPETQPLMMLLESDLTPILMACIQGTLKPEMVRFRPGAAACVVLASAGYPGSSTKGVIIEGFDTVCDPSVHVFLAGTLKTRSGVVTDGGRVFGVTSYGTTIGEALKRAYGAIGPDGVHFDGMQYRSDIGKQAYGQ